MGGRGPSNGRGGSPLPPAREWPWRTCRECRRNSEEQQRGTRGPLRSASPSLRDLPSEAKLLRRISASPGRSAGSAPEHRRTGFREPASRSGGGGDGPQGTAVPTMGFGGGAWRSGARHSHFRGLMVGLRTAENCVPAVGVNCPSKCPYTMGIYFDNSQSEKS